MNTLIKTADDLKAVLKQYTGSDKIAYDMSYWGLPGHMHTPGALEYLSYSRGTHTLVFRKTDGVTVELIDVWPKYKRSLWQDGLTHLDMKTILPLLQRGGTIHGHWRHGLSIRLASPLTEMEVLDLFKIGFYSYEEHPNPAVSAVLIMRG